MKVQMKRMGSLPYFMQNEKVFARFVRDARVLTRFQNRTGRRKLQAKRVEAPSPGEGSPSPDGVRPKLCNGSGERVHDLLDLPFRDAMAQELEYRPSGGLRFQFLPWSEMRHHLL
jgi:hypothetical protein